MERLPLQQQALYARDFCLADEGFNAGRVAAHSTNRTKHWKRWCSYVQPLGVDPLLKRSNHTERTRLLSGFAARTQTGYYGRGRQVKASTVSTALTAIGQTIALECERNPTKIIGSNKLIPRLQQMLDGWRKIDPPTLKMLPVEADVPEYLATLGAQPSASVLDQAIGDLTLIAFYYLLHIGEYTCKAKRNESKQMVQFKMEDVTFFKQNKLGEL
jgi:hypothetical protein